MIQHDETSDEMRAALTEYRARLDPVLLLHTIREAQSALVAATAPEVRETPSGESLSKFLGKLPRLWRQGEVRPTHAARVRGPRHWRTRRTLSRVFGASGGLVAGRAGCCWQGCNRNTRTGSPPPFTVAGRGCCSQRGARRFCPRRGNRQGRPACRGQAAAMSTTVLGSYKISRPPRWSAAAGSVCSVVVAELQQPRCHAFSFSSGGRTGCPAGSV